jgi:hypothetical protein
LPGADSVVIEKPLVWGLFKNGQMQGAQKTEPRGVYVHTLSGAVLQRNTAYERFSTAPQYPLFFDSTT